MLSLPPFALQKDLERTNFNETGKWKKREREVLKKITLSWLFTVSSVIYTNSPTWHADNPLQESWGKIPLSNICFLNSKCLVIYSFLPHSVCEIALKNRSRMPVVAGMVKQMVSPKEKHKHEQKKTIPKNQNQETHKVRICQIRYEHKNHCLSEKKLPVFCLLSQLCLNC